MIKIDNAYVKSELWETYFLLTPEHAINVHLVIGIAVIIIFFLKHSFIVLGVSHYRN